MLRNCLLEIRLKRNKCLDTYDEGEQITYAEHTECKIVELFPVSFLAVRIHYDLIFFATEDNPEANSVWHKKFEQ